MACFDINVFIMASENSCKIGRCQGDLLQRRPGTVQHRTVPGRASADVFLYRRAGAHPICDHARENSYKNRPLPGRLSNLPVMCKSLKSYEVSFL